ncbi:tldc domain-containing protein [Stylonychia lemnae]|uniref:Tldc domain-containing protein n=1 Tax=Stylonychia lemnae TaxID=5949 RepID=A0A078B9F3_STYLE|nr:tldc domain-containing protein [Stylonychia lemnae]|eukprot:CDW89882.1 tldc domain-containing protein [Stylonychia lemnae]
MIISCGHIICNQCIQNQFQNNKTLVTCHQGDSCNQVEDFKLTPVKELMYYLDKIPTLNITCDTHPHKMVKIYCKKTNKIVCKKCQTDCNNGHHEEIDHQNILRKDLENYIEQKIPSLKILLEKIQVLIQNLQQYQSKDKMFGASEFLDMITQINKYLDPDQSLEGKSLTKKINLRMSYCGLCLKKINQSISEDWLTNNQNL